MLIHSFLQLHSCVIDDEYNLSVDIKGSSTHYKFENYNDVIDFVYDHIDYRVIDFMINFEKQRLSVLIEKIED